MYQNTGSQLKKNVSPHFKELHPLKLARPVKIPQNFGKNAKFASVKVFYTIGKHISYTFSISNLFSCILFYNLEKGHYLIGGKQYLVKNLFLFQEY